MRIAEVHPDGSLTLHLSKADAIAVRDDLGAIDHRAVSRPGDQLHSLLDSIHPGDPR